MQWPHGYSIIGVNNNKHWAEDYAEIGNKKETHWSGLYGEVGKALKHVSAANVSTNKPENMKRKTKQTRCNVKRQKVSKSDIDLYSTTDDWTYTPENKKRKKNEPHHNAKRSKVQMFVKTKGQPFPPGIKKYSS